MMEKVNLVFRYISYKLFARHKYGHGIHSPFIYGFIKDVLNNRKPSAEIIKIENKRREYLRNGKILEIVDYGAGSKFSKKKSRSLKSIVRTSSVNRKYGSMLYRLVKYYNPDTIIELGTSAGVSALYLATANPQIKVISIEGNKNLARVALGTFKDLAVNNIELITDTFDMALPEILKKSNGKVMLFIDGNHTKNGVLSCLRLCKSHNNECLIVVDDINWSQDMLFAWKTIKSDKTVSISIDLFFMGIVILSKKFIKQNFVIKF